MKIFFVRHADPKKEDYSLTKKGEEQSELLGKFLKDKQSEKIYSGSFGRSFFTAELLNKHLNLELETKTWLNEFKHLIKIDEEHSQYPWELNPKLWLNDKEALSFTEMFSHPIYNNENLKANYEKVTKNFDELLLSYGYKRNNYLYEVLEGNEKTILIVSHFATISVLLSHLFNISLFSIFHMFYFSPSSYIKVLSQEFEKGEAIFRCCELGSMEHLSQNTSLKSYYGLLIPSKNAH